MKNILIFIVLVVSCIAVLPFFQSGFFSFHDNTQVQRVYEMHKALSDGHFPVRWVPDLGYGYGYPIFNFYAPFAYYVGSIINFVVDSLVATKIMMLFGIFLASVSMYFFVKDIFGKYAAAVSSILYMFAPYHALDIYVRGDVAEFYATALIPFVFLSVWRLIKRSSWHNVAFLSVSYALLILSHNLTAMMVTPFLIGFMVLVVFFRKVADTQKFALLLGSLFLGIGLSAFYVLPVFLEMKYTNVLSVIGGGSHFADHFICPSQLWKGPWGYLGSIPGCQDGMSFQLGKIHIMVSFVAFVVLSTKLWKRVKTDQLLIMGFGSVGLVLSILFTLSVSEFLWQSIPFMSFFQFPWRFLIMATFFSSLLGGSLLWLLEEKVKMKNMSLMFVFTIVSLVIIAGFYSKYFHPQQIHAVTASDYTNQRMLRFTTSKISDEYMPPGFIKPKKEEDVVSQQFILSKGEGTITFISNQTQQKIIKVESTEGVQLLAKIAPYPSWQGSIDGKKVDLQATSLGYVLPLSSGSHTINLTFTSTLAQNVANGVSVICVILLLLGALKRYKHYVTVKER